jgi:hypothetical protein
VGILCGLLMVFGVVLVVEFEVLDVGEILCHKSMDK